MAFAGWFKRNSDKDSTGIGATNVTYFPGVTLPRIDATGGGVIPKRFWQIAQPEQYFFNAALPAVGIPGIVSGQFAMQGLQDFRGIRPL